MVLSSSPELQPPKLVVDAAIFLHPERLLLGKRRTAAGASRSMEPFQFPVSQNPPHVGSNSRVWMNCVALRHVPGDVRPPARYRQQGLVRPSYPVWVFRLDSPPCRFRSSTTWCGRALRSLGFGCYLEALHFWTCWIERYNLTFTNTRWEEKKMQGNMWQSLVDYARIDRDTVFKEVKKATTYDNMLAKFEMTWG